MGFRTSLICSILFATIISAQYQPQQTNPQQQAPQTFGSSEAQQSDSSPSAANIAYRARPYSNYNNARDEDEDDEDAAPAIYQTRRPVLQFRKPQDIKHRPTASEEELEEEEEPDRLSLLLEKSSFHCGDRTTGYYADEGLGCEVFHYCQENQKHSWICPEGFTFHQVHLICMPPSSDNICDQSSKYHFVNEYLYKPINMEEHQARPNITLRYSERYYPENFYLDERTQEHEQQEQQHRQRQPIQVGLPSFKKPSPAPLPYRVSTPTPSQQNVYRSPEEINISLQQRRPILFSSPSTPRYEEEEYSFEQK